MASSSPFGSKLAELKQELRDLEEQKAAELKRERGTPDHELLLELNKDMDRVQAAITALSCGELYFPFQLLPHTPLWYSLPYVRAFSCQSTLHISGHVTWLQCILMFKK